jgi:predicted dehydrogenase
MTLKVALVGCGKVADQHIAEIQKVPWSRVAAVCDEELLMAKQVAVRYGIDNYYTSFDEMLAVETPDVVHIATPPRSHLSLAYKALDANCHVMVEKPLTLDCAEAQQLIAHAERRQRKLTVGYTYYLDPIIRTLRALVQEGVMGEVVHLESFLGYDLSGPFGTPLLADPEHWVHMLPGGLLQNVLDHLVNKIMEFLPDDTLSVQVRSWQRSRELSHLESCLLDELRIMVTGQMTSAYATFSAHIRPVHHTLAFYGTKSTAHLDFTHGTITLDSRSKLPGVIGRLVTPFEQSWEHFRQGGKNLWRFAQSDYQYFAGFQALIAQFYDSILRDTPLPIPHKEILRVSMMTDRVIQQLRGTEVLHQ